MKIDIYGAWLYCMVYLDSGDSLSLSIEFEELKAALLKADYLKPNKLN